MLNLAPLYYLNIMKDKGGPIEEFKSSKVSIDFFKNGYKTLVKLSPAIISKRPKLNLYSDWDGTGSDEYFKISFYKAVSEALERWSFYALSNSNRYGLDIDCSTNGFAAFPSLFSSRARESAYVEAFERWSLINWWGNNLDSKKLSLYPEISSIGISDDSLGLITIIHYKLCENSYMSYGFASGRTIVEAGQRALVELKRNYDLLSNLSEDKKNSILVDGHLIERRLLYFASAPGVDDFEDRIGKKRSKSIRSKLIVDSLVDGPWLKYSKVWRCLFEPIEVDDNEVESCFLF